MQNKELEQSIFVLLANLRNLNPEAVSSFIFYRGIKNSVLSEFDKCSAYIVSSLLEDIEQAFADLLYQAHTCPKHKDNELIDSESIGSSSLATGDNCDTNVFIAYNRGQSLVGDVLFFIKDYKKCGMELSIEDSDRRITDYILRIVGWFEVSRTELGMALAFVITRFFEIKQKIVRIPNREIEDAEKLEYLEKRTQKMREIFKK